MITQADIDAAKDRLVDNKLVPTDVNKLVSVLRKMFAGLETQYNYQFQSKLEAFDDTGNDAEICAQIAACINAMEELGFPVGELTGTRTGVKGSEFTEFGNYVLEVFSKMYPIPIEFSTFELRRGSFGRSSNRSSGTIQTTRSFCD